MLDIADMRNIKVISKWNHSPPFNGFTHTVLTLFERGLWIVSDECVQDNGADWPKLVWLFVFLLPRASQSVTKWVDLCLAIFIEPLN